MHAHWVISSRLPRSSPLHILSLVAQHIGLYGPEFDEVLAIIDRYQAEQTTRVPQLCDISVFFVISF